MEDKPIKTPNLANRFVSIFSDEGFKATFGNKTDTSFLKKALQAVLKKRYKIEKVTFNPEENIGITTGSRGGVYDVTFVDDTGKIFIVEMQMSSFKAFIHRAKWYGFLKLNTLVKKGKYKFSDLNPIIIISFLGGKAFQGKEFRHIGKLRNQHGKILDDQITHYIIELGKWDKKVSEIKDDLDKLIYLMKVTESAKIDEPLILPSFMEENWLQKALHVLETRKLTPLQYEAYVKGIVRQNFMELDYEERFETEKKKLEKVAKAKIKEEKKRLEKEKEKEIKRLKTKKAEEIRKLEIERAEEIRELEIERAEEKRRLKVERAEEIRKLEEEKEKETIKIIALERQKAQEAKEKAIRELLLLKILKDEQIALIQNVNLDYVLKIKKTLNF